MSETPCPTQHGKQRWIAAGAFALIPVLLLALHIGWVASAYAFFDGKWTGPYNLMKPAYLSILWMPTILKISIALGIGGIVWLGIRHKLKWPRPAIAGVIVYALSCLLYARAIAGMGYILAFGFYPEHEVARQDAYGNTYILLTGQPAFFDGSYFLLVECRSAWRCKMLEGYKSAQYKIGTLELDDGAQTAHLNVAPFIP